MSIPFESQDQYQLKGIIESQRREIDHTLACDEQRRRDQLPLHEQLSEQSRELREAHMKSLQEMEELRKFQSSAFDTMARRKLVENQNTILELSGRIQDLQNEINCMIDSKEFQDAELIRSGQSHITSQPVFFAPHPVPGGMLSRSFGVPSRREGPPSIWDTHGNIGTRFLQIQMHLQQHLIPKNCINGIHRSKSRSIHPQWKRVKGKNKIKIRDASPDRQPKIQSSSVEETLQRIMGLANNDFRFRIFTSTNSSHQQRLLAGR